MTSPRLRQHDPKLSGLQLILTMAIAASKATAGPAIKSSDMQTARQLFET
jgi:hypothetical protein